MSERFTHHANKQSHANVVIYAPLPWATNRSNMGRYDILAEQTGYDVVTRSVRGTGSVIIDKSTQRALKKWADYHDASEIAAEEAVIAQIATSDYETRIGLGDSGRGMWVAAMQVTTGCEAPFTHVLIRDGVNLEPRSLPKGAFDVVVRGHQRGTTGPNQDESHDNTTVHDKLMTAAQGVSEIVHHSALVRGTAGKVALQRMAIFDDHPAMIVGLGYGIGGTIEAMETFTRQLGADREITGVAAPISFYGEPRWGHGNLLDVHGIQKHVHLAIGNSLTA